MDHPNIAKVLDAGATEALGAPASRRRVGEGGEKFDERAGETPVLPGRPYFVMELVRGIKITEYCDQNKLSTKQRLDLFIQVCNAIQHAHQKGVIHRDIKPSNILVTLHDGVPVPKVIDFGIAKATSDQRLTDKTLFTAFEQFIGTPAYMSPEQAEMSGLDIDTRSDIYSLGVLLYELLTGKTPFDAKELLEAGLDEMRRIIREKEPLRPSTRLSTELAAAEQGRIGEGEKRGTGSGPESGSPTPLVSSAPFPAGSTAASRTASRQQLQEKRDLIDLIRGDLDWIVMKTLEKDRTRRYETANGVAADILRHLNNEPVVARPPSVAYRFQKLVRRNKLAFAAAGAVAAALFIGLGVSTWLFLKERTARQRAVAAESKEKSAREQAQEAQANEAKQRLQLAESLNQLELQKVEELFAVDDSPTALTYLARALRRNPTNRIAAERLLSALSHRSYALPLSETLKHETVVMSAQFSPDGQRVVTASLNQTARVWDATTGQPLIEALKHKDGVESAQFSPDGQWVVTASRDKTARVWDAKTGQPLTEPLKHDAAVNSAQFSPDGQRVVTASDDQTARVWDATTGQPLTPPLKHESGVRSAQFSPDGQRVVTASADQTARIWNAATGRRLTAPLKHEHWVLSAQFSLDGQRVVTASVDQTARVWDAKTGQPLTAPLKHEDAVNSAEFSPDGQRVVTASWDQTARLWDAKTGQPLTAPLKHEAEVRSAQFSPDGQRVVTASGDTARVWGAKTGRPLSAPLKHETFVRSAQFSPDGQRVVTASGDNTARVWDAKAGQALTEPLKHGGSVTSAEFSPDGQRVVTASGDKTARVWDAKTGQPLTAPLQHEKFVESAQFSPDGQRVVTASRDKTARVWDAKTGQPLSAPLKHETFVRSAQFSPDGQRVVTASDDQTARVWDAKTGQPLSAPLKHVNAAILEKFGAHLSLSVKLKHENSVNSAQFSPDGQRVVTASYDKSARVWDAQTGQPLTPPLKHEDQVMSAQFSPDGQRVVTASGDKTARVWDAQTGQPLTEPLKHEASVGSARFSPDGQRVVTAGDKTARIWDAKTGQPLTEPLQHEARVESAQFSPDGHRVVTASIDFTARIWESPRAPLPVPGWVAKLTEAIAGKRLDDQGIWEPVPLPELLAIKRQVSSSPALDIWTRLAKWLFADPATRTISPFSEITAPEYVQRRVQKDWLGSLHEAIQLSPTNGLALARLARRVLEQDDKDNPRRIGEADFFSRRAVELSPNDAEVLSIREEIKTKTNR